MADPRPSEPDPPRAPQVAAPAGNADVASAARSTSIVSIAVLLSRVLGLVRDRVLATRFGADFNGIFAQAFGMPNMLRDLFAEGALSTAFVTTFSKKLKTEGEEAAWRLGRKMFTLAACFMSLLSILGIVIARPLTNVLVAGWAPWKKDLVASLAQIMYPFITIVSLTALAMGILNAKKKFFVPAVASAFFNLGCIVGGFGLAWLLDPGFRRGEVTWTAMASFAVGTLIGGMCQFLVQWPTLRSVGFRFRPDFGWNDDGVREVLRLMWPSLIAAGGVQINVLINSFFASFTWGEASAKSWMQLAQRLQQLPLGLFGVAVATVTLPALSRAATDGVSPAFREVLAKGLRLVMFLVVPCAAGLALFSREIISVIFEGRRFGPEDVFQTARVLEAYACGLLFYAMLKVVQPAFFAIDRRFFPMQVSLGMIAFNIVVNTTTVFVLGWDHAALAWSTAIGLALNFGVSYLAMRRFASGLHTRETLRGMVKVLAAAAAMVAVCLPAKWWFQHHWAGLEFWARVSALGAVIAVAAVVYWGLAGVLRVTEAADFGALLKRRLGRK
jgi:putative peptidoglycan lipid II flippase